MIVRHKKCGLISQKVKVILISKRDVLNAIVSNAFELISLQKQRRVQPNKVNEFNFFAEFRENYYLTKIWHFGARSYRVRCVLEPVVLTPIP